MWDAHGSEKPSLIYSNAVQINADGSFNFDRFDARYGWEVVEHEGWIETLAMAPTPHNVSCICHP